MDYVTYGLTALIGSITIYLYILRPIFNALMGGIIPRKLNECPKCKEHSADRIPRGLLKVFFPFLKVKRYRCLHCSYRFYVWKQ